MAGLLEMGFWAHLDEKDKYDAEPNGAFYLSGTITVGPTDIVLKAGSKVGISIRRNKNRTKDNQPSYRGDLYQPQEREDGAQPPQGGQS